MELGSVGKPSWEEFVGCNLLSSGDISGIMLMSPKGTVSYTYGILSSTPQEDFLQIVDLFRVKPHQDNTAVESGIALKVAGNKTEFRIFKRTYCSVYCATAGGSSGLILSNLPYGILVCYYKPPTTTSQATKTVETFCDKLRA